MATEIFGPLRQGNLLLGYLQRGQLLANNSYSIMHTRLANHTKRILDPRGPFWNWILFAVCITSTSSDPLLFYVFVVNDHKKCVHLDIKLAITVIAFRTILDLFYMINSSSTQHKNGRANARNFFFLSSFLMHLSSCLPVAQMVTSVILMRARGLEFFSAMVLLKATVVIQYVPRFYQIYRLYTEAERTSGILAQMKWVKVGGCILIYLLVAHVFGALWYLMAIEKETRCWKKACIDHTRCRHRSFYCYNTCENYTFLSGFCPDTAMLDFGIFQQAIQSGIVEETNFMKRFLFCFRWGLQTISCAGQNLQTSTHEGENLFASFIIVTSLLLLLLVLGNIVIYLQTGTIRSEEMKFKVREIEQWQTFGMLSQNIQQQVRNHQQYVWQETRGIDVENLLNNLPNNLSWEIKSGLCLELLKKVPMFQIMGEQILSKMCKHLKPVLYAQECYIVKEGNPISEMLFITQGRIRTTVTNGEINTNLFKGYLSIGDFWGEELTISVLDPNPLSNLPRSKCTVSSITNVEAFTLKGDDLRAAVYEFWRLHNPNMQPLDIFRFYSPQWRTSKARIIQAAWCGYKKRKLETSL